MNVETTKIPPCSLPMLKAHFNDCLNAESKNGADTFLKSLAEKTTSSERIAFIHEKLNHYNLSAAWYRESHKDDSKAMGYKERGNKSFGMGQYNEALKSYTKTVMTAESQELLSKAYANRSAALFKLELYEECLTDIRRAFTKHYPENLQAKIIIRRNKATQLLAEIRQRNGTPMLSYHEEVPTIPTNLVSPITPSVANNVKIKSCKTGKKVVAMKNIKIGDIIAVEESAATYIEGPYLYHCHHCFELCYNPIPCNVCTEVLYCGKACKRKAFLSYHKHECPILLSLRNYLGQRKFLLVAVKAFLQSTQRKSDQVMGFSQRQQMALEMTAALIYELLRRFTDIFRGPQGQASESRFKDSIMDLFTACYVQNGGIFALCPFNDGGETGFQYDQVATGLYEFYAMIRHSCAPNAISHHYGTKKVVRATSTIKKGQEVFVSYGPHYAQAPREDRQKYLEEYNFKCTCRACEEDWPEVDRLPPPASSSATSPPMPCPLSLIFPPPRAPSCSSSDDRRVSAPQNVHPIMELAKLTVRHTIKNMKSMPTADPNIHFRSQQKTLCSCYEALANRRMIS